MNVRLWLRHLKRGPKYYLSFRYKGLRYTVATGTADKKLANKVREEIERKIVLGTFDVVESQIPSIKLSAFGKQYFSNVGGTKAQSTIDGEKVYFETFKIVIGDIDLDKIGITTLEYWRSQRLSKIKPVTFNTERATLAAIFTKAVEYGHLKENPFKKLKKLKVQEHRYYMTRDEEMRFFSTLDGQIERSYSDRHRQLWELFKKFCIVQIDTGMRRSETLNMRWSHIDFRRHLIIVEETKGKRVREIPMTNRVMNIIRDIGEDLFHEFTPKKVTERFALVADRASLPEYIKLHSLRHTFATRLIGLGVDISVVSKLLGHTTIQTTMVYAKATLDTLRNAISELDAYENGNILATREPMGRKLLERGSGDDRKSARS